MAEFAVKSAASWLGKLLVEEGKYLWGAEGKFAELRNELVWMQCFLRDADALQYDDEIVGIWVLQIREYVSKAEDIIEKFVLDVTSCRRQVGWSNRVKRWSCIGMELFAVHQLVSKIDSLKLKISMLTPKLQTYGLKTAYGMKTYRTREALIEKAEQRMSYAHLESKNIVGLEQDTQALVDALLNSTTKSRVTAIYGMGGLGKTTLATKVYHHSEIRSHFTGGFAWAYISKHLQAQNVLQILITDLTSKSTDLIGGKGLKDLIHELREFLQKNKCLIVLDDVWEPGVCDIVNAALPSTGMESGSKVLLTTRKEEVANYVDREALHKPNPLNVEESWELLQETLGWVITAGNSGVKKDVQADIGGISCKKSTELEVNGCKGEEFQTEIAGSPSHGCLLTEMFGTEGTEMINLGKQMVKHCNGIPLAIVVLGGILRKKETLDEWRIVCENMTSYLRRGNDHGRSYMEVLVLSYNDLPYHLKPCFLHLGNFPEDYEIQTGKLYRMWVAEGLVTWPRDRVSGTESLVDFANDYLSDLAQAGMVQVINKGANGRIKSIRVHDLMRDLCLQKAATENFFSIVDHRPCPDEPQIISSSLTHERLLHMAIYLAQGVKKYLPDSLTSDAHKYLRSLLFFVGQGVNGGGYEQWMKCICNDFPWLRVLDIQGLRLQGRLTKDIQKVRHLRYLSLKETNVSELPSSIGNLRFLQTLDVRVSFVGSSIKIPNTLWKLERLRHLLLPTKPYEVIRSNFLWLDTLRCLETLKNLEYGKFRVKDLLGLKKLKKLSIKDNVSEVESMKTIVESPAVKSGNLRSCSLGVKGNVIAQEPKILSNFDCLRRLNVVEKISAFKENVLPRFLEVLHLEFCELETDPMRILGSLRHLKDLFLGIHSFVGKEIICQAESFPQLTVLNLRGLAKLEVWALEQRSMPGLKKLIIMNCGKLKSIPDDLPSGVHVTCSPCINGIERYGTCICYRDTSFSVVDSEEDFFGHAEDTRSLVNLLVNNQNKKVVLLGSGGGGKSTLAKMLCHQPEILREYEAIAWAHCPQRWDHSPPINFIHGLLRQLAPDLSQDSSSNIISRLGEIMQQKKCLVVLTDLTVHPEKIDAIFEASCFLKGSKVLVTAEQSSSRDSDELVSHKLRPMSNDETWALFMKRVEGALSGTDGPIKVELGKSMLEHCCGQPLPIIMLAGLLAMKQTLIEWQSIQKEVALRVQKARGAHQLIYGLSYDDLPPHLKHCFLYLANFPRGTYISTRKLYHMWIGAGLVRLKDDVISSKNRKGVEIGVVELLENVAENYLTELVFRGMVQVGKRGPTRRIGTCRLHVALSSLCLEKAREEHFVTIISQTEPSSSASNDSLITEHLAVHSKRVEMESRNPTATTDRLSSLLFFPEISNSSNHNLESNWQWFVEICHHFRFLQVLDLEGMLMIRGILPAEVGNLSQLKYLSLKGTLVSELPSTIEQLSNLQTLDLRVVEHLFIPDVLFNFKSLRHLHLPGALKASTLHLQELDHLQTLANLHTDKVDLDCIPELRNLRKISIKNIHAEKELDDKIKDITSRVDISINSEILDGNSTILSSFRNLRKVTIKGVLGTLAVDMFPACLKELTLKHTALVDDPIPVLEKLPSLTHLFLDHDSFLGEKMTFSLGFPLLTHLRFRLLSNLKMLDMTAADHLRCLHCLTITDCWRLEVTEMSFPTAEIRLGPLGHHPFMSLLAQR